MENPIEVLHQCIAHAQYEGFSPIVYKKKDWEYFRTFNKEKYIEVERRPTIRDFEVIEMFPQTWGSTALGHGGIGGAAMTTAYTVVLACYDTREYLVYFGGRLCYNLNMKSKNIDRFLSDCRDKNLVHITKVSEYQ